jgi:glutamate/aspartate transport system substrate-binding protein
MLMPTCLSLLVVLTLLASPALGQPRSTLEKIQATKTLTLGYRETSFPFSYATESGAAAGYSVDLCSHIATSLQHHLGLPDLQVTWTVVTPENRLALVANGTIDLECGSTTNTLARQEQVDFSVITFVDGGSLLVSTAAHLQRLADLAGKRVAIIPGTTTEQALAAALQRARLSVQLVPVTEHGEGVAAVLEGRAEAYASDRVLLMGLALNAPDPTKLALADIYFSYEPYGLMLRRGDADFRLAVNRVLARLYRSGDIIPIFERWFGPFAGASDLLQAMYLLQSLPE